MLLSAVCTVLTAIQSFPLEEWQAAFVEEYIERPRKTVTADVSNKLGWNLHVQPLGDKVRHKPKRVKNFDDDSFTLERWYNKAATSGKPPSHDGAAWKALLSEADRFVDALNKQVKPVNNTGTKAPKVRRLKIDATSEFAKNNGTTNVSVSASSPESKPTSTAKPSCEKGTYQPTARRVSRFQTSGDPTMLQNGTGRAASSTAPEHIKPKPADQPTLGEGVAELFTSPPPLNQSETYGTKTITRKPSVWTTERTRTSTNPAVKISKKRRRFRVKPRTTKPPKQPQPFDRLKSAVVGTETTNTRLLDRVNNANNDSSLTPQTASNSSRPKVLRRRKKRPKLNLFKPRSRQPTAVQNWTSSPSKCRTAEVWRLSGRCGNSTVSVNRPAQRQRQEDHMTQSSVVRPRVYRLDPGAGSEERKSQFSRPATTSNRHLHRPSAYPASYESHEDYYDYSPEYHDDYYPVASLEDLSDEVTHETDHDERDAVRTDVSSERQSPTLDTNATREETKGNTEAQKSIGETVGFNATSAIDKTGVEGPVASSVTLRDTEEGFKLLVHDNSELPSIEPAQSTANSTSAKEMPDRSPRETQPPPTDPTSEAASELTAVSPAVHVMPAADSVREVHEASSSHQDKGAGISSGFFSFAEVPAPGHHRFGYRKGNDQHFTGRLELADGPHVKSVVVWADRKGGYGKHIWDYNHKDHKH